MPVLFPVRIQVTVAAQVFYGVKHFMGRTVPVVFGLGVVHKMVALFRNDTVLLHQQHIRGSEAGDGPAVFFLFASHHVPEQGRDFVKIGGIGIFALAECPDGIFIKKTVQGLGRNNVFPFADQFQNALVIRGLLRTFCFQFPQKALVPFLYSGNKNDKALVF